MRTDMPGVQIKVNGIETRSYANGIVSIEIPLPQQKNRYTISAAIPLKDSLKAMPCGDHDVMVFQ